MKDAMMPANPNSSDDMVGMLRDTIVALVRKGDYNLSARQLGVFLTCYLEDREHTVRGLATDLNVSKPAITRALDRLGKFDLARRQTDPRDRRSVLVQRTRAGQAYLRNLHRTTSRTKEMAKTPESHGDAAMDRSAP